MTSSSYRGGLVVQLPGRSSKASGLGGRSHRVVFLVLAAWALLLAAWVITNPPFASPDEAEHYIRAVGISEGHLIGPSDPSVRIGVDARQIAWTRQATRLVTLPAGLDPLPFTCATGTGNLSAACLNSAKPIPSRVTLPTAVGNYQPLPYLLPAAIMRAASSPPDVLRWGRAAGALVAFALLAVALLALYDASYPVLSILGLLLAVTPMALFCAASLNGSGLEITSGIAFFSCLLRLTRAGPVPRRWWAAAALSGATLALSRPASPLWIVIALGVVAAWDGPRALVARWVRSRVAWLAAAGLVLAVTLNRVWEARYGSHVAIDTSSLHAGLVAGAHEWWRALPEMVGKFGYIDVKLPVVLPIVWFALILVLVVAASRGHRRDRVILGSLTVCALVLPVIFYALITRPTGFGLQGRQLLPTLVILPLLAGEVYYRHRERITSLVAHHLIRVLPVGVGVMQVAAWYVNAKRFAVGSSGALWFPSQATWEPPAGWAVWLVLMILSVVCFVAVTTSVWRASSDAVGA